MQLLLLGVREEVSRWATVRTFVRSSGRKNADTTTDPPDGVNLRALDMRFLITWFILNLSTNTLSESRMEPYGCSWSCTCCCSCTFMPDMTGGEVEDADGVAPCDTLRASWNAFACDVMNEILIPASFAWDENIFTQSDMNGITGVSSLCKSSMPLSILSKHNKSLRISTAASHDVLTLSSISQFSRFSISVLSSKFPHTNLKPARCITAIQFNCEVRVGQLWWWEWQREKY